MEYALARRLDRGVPLSVEFANWAANRVIDRDQDGHFFWEVIKGYEAHGICGEAEMPYAAEFRADRQPSEAALASAAKLKHPRLTFHWVRPYDGKTGLGLEEGQESTRSLLDRALREPGARGVAASAVERHPCDDVPEAAGLELEVGRLENDGERRLVDDP